MAFGGDETAAHAWIAQQGADAERARIVEILRDYAPHRVEANSSGDARIVGDVVADLLQLVTGETDEVTA